MLNARHETLEKIQERQVIQAAIPKYLANPANIIKVIPFVKSGLPLVLDHNIIEDYEE